MPNGNLYFVGKTLRSFFSNPHPIVYLGEINTPLKPYSKAAYHEIISFNRKKSDRASKTHGYARVFLLKLALVKLFHHADHFIAELLLCLYPVR